MADRPNGDKNIEQTLKDISKRIRNEKVESWHQVADVRERIFKILNSKEFELIERKLLELEDGRFLNDSFQGLIFRLGGLSRAKTDSTDSRENKRRDDDNFSFLENSLISCADEKYINIFLEKRSEVIATIEDKINQGLIQEDKLYEAKEEENAEEPEDHYHLKSWRKKMDLAMLTSFIGHSLQKRKDGSPYVIHPLETTKLLIENTDLYSLDTWLATCLHDAFEDLGEYFDISELKEVLLIDLNSSDVISLIEGVTKIGSHKEASNVLPNMKKIIEEVSKDIRCLYMKLADRLHNMRTIQNLTKEDQERIARETLDFYCPLARKFGIRKMEDLLAELSLTVLDQDKKKQLDNYINQEMYPGEELSRVITSVIDMYFNNKYYQVKDIFVDAYNNNTITEKQSRELEAYSSKDIDLNTLLTEYLDAVDENKREEIIEEIEKDLKLNFGCEIQKRTLHKAIRTSLEDQKIHLSEAYSDFGAFDLEKSEPFRISFCVEDEETMDKIRNKLRFLGEPLDSRDIKGNRYNNYKGIVGKANFSLLKKFMNEIGSFHEGKELRDLLNHNESVVAKYEKYTKDNSRILIEIFLKKDQESNQKGIFTGVYDQNIEKDKLSADFLQKFEEISAEFKSSRELLAFLKTEILASNQIKCIGEDGDILILPKGITLYKLAMRISSQIALNYDYCLINGKKELDFNYVLQDGDQFEFVVSEKRKLLTPEIFLLLGEDEINNIKSLRQMIQQNINQEVAEFDLDQIIDEGRQFFQKSLEFLFLIPDINISPGHISESDIQRFLSSHPEISEEVMKYTSSYGALSLKKRFFLAFSLGILKVDTISAFAEDVYDKELLDCKNSLVFSINKNVKAVEKSDLSKIIDQIEHIAMINSMTANFKLNQIALTIELPRSVDQKLKAYLLLDMVGKVLYPDSYKMNHQVV